MPLSTVVPVGDNITYSRGLKHFSDRFKSEMVSELFKGLKAIPRLVAGIGHVNVLTSVPCHDAGQQNLENSPDISEEGTGCRGRTRA